MPVLQLVAAVLQLNVPWVPAKPESFADDDDADRRHAFGTVTAFGKALNARNQALASVGRRHTCKTATRLRQHPGSSIEP